MNNSKKKHLGNNALLLTGSKIVTAVIGMLSAMLLSRFRTLTEYGTYSQLMMIINISCSLFMLGLPNCINYFLAKAESEEERGKFLSVYYTLSTLLSIIIGAVMVLIVPLLEKYFKNELIKYFWYFLAVYPWTRVIMSGVENLLIVYDQTEKLVLYRILNSAALLLIVILVQAMGGTFPHYMLAFVAVECIFTVWVYVIAYKNTGRLRFSLDLKLIKTIFIFSVPIGIASILGTLNKELDKLVITTFFSIEEMAIYSNAAKELPVTMITTSLTAVLLPQIVRLMKKNSKYEAVELWKNATTISFAIISFISVACFVFAPEVITVLYSEKYISGTGVFRVYTLELLLRCTYWGMMLNAVGCTKAILFSSIGTLTSNLFLNFMFYYLIGFEGPAVATFMSTLLMVLFQLAYTSGKIKIKFSAIFPWKNCLLLLILNVIIGVIAYMAKMLVTSYSNINSIALAIGLGIVWFGVYTVLCIKPLKKHWLLLNKER